MNLDQKILKLREALTSEEVKLLSEALTQFTENCDAERYPEQQMQLDAAEELLEVINLTFLGF